MNASNSSNRAGLVRIGVVVLVLVAVTGVAAFFFSRNHTVGAHEPGHGEAAAARGEDAIPVKSVKPQLKPNFQMTVERPCDVDAYYTAPIEARAAGVITYLKVAPGSRVKKGQMLVVIDVPDRVGDLKEKVSLVKQRQAEVKLADEKIQKAEAFKKTAEANIVVAERDAEYRKRDYNRLYALRQTSAVDQNVVDIAYFHWKKSEADVLKAKAELEDAEANIKVAKAELRQKEELVHVAEGDRDEAEALLEYAHVKAPFDAAVIRRLVNPGATVQDATRGSPTPLLVLERNDIVTVSMQLPDNYSQLVTPGTEAVMEFASLPGLKIHGRVTRYSDSLASPNHDRTMRVEVDLWNGTVEEYRNLEKKYQEYLNGTEKDRQDLETKLDLKNGMDGKPALPLMPKFEGKDRLNRSTSLKSKMYGKMTLVLRNFGKSYLIPSQAILRDAGRSLVYVVRGGKARLMPVEEVVNDGNLAMVERLDDKDNVVGPLDGTEEIIVSNQEELSDGQPVKPTLVDDYKTIEKKK